MAENNPLLADIVLAGDKQKQVADLGNGIFMSRDVSNVYLVTTADGDVLINTGIPTSTERHRAMFAPVRTGALRYIILTQSHGDHFGGVPGLREAGTKVIAERRFSDTCRYYKEMEPYFTPRQVKLWGPISMGNGIKLPEVEPDITVDGKRGLEVGRRRFVLLSTPGGETVDSLSVWMPDDKIVFTGNLFGPIWLSMPFLNTLRGDKPRLVGRYLESLDIIRDLGAEMLITGHGDPIIGADKVRADLDLIYNAVSYVNQAVIDGMNGGKDMYALMREIRLPEHLKIGEFHGNVPWAVRAIFHEYAGWFLYDSTTSLYGVPRSSVDTDIAEMAGGADALADRARTRLGAGQMLEAMHLIDIALGADPGNRPALSVKRDVLSRLLSDSGSTNLSETMWLRSEIAETDHALANA